MKSNPIVGVTILEILILFGVAGLVLIMAVKFYDYASIHQQANTVIAHITSISAAADNLSQGTNSYQSSVTAASLQDSLQGDTLRTPWGSTIELIDTTTNSYTINIPGMPAKVCQVVKTKIATSQKYNTSQTICPSQGIVDFVYTYSN